MVLTIREASCIFMGSDSVVALKDNLPLHFNSQAWTTSLDKTLRKWEISSGLLLKTQTVSHPLQCVVSALKSTPFSVGHSQLP